MDQLNLSDMLEEDLIRSLADRAGRNGRTLREEVRTILTREASVDRSQFLLRLSERCSQVQTWNFFEEIGRGTEKRTR
jgi:plasmid stability protein